MAHPYEDAPVSKTGEKDVSILLDSGWLERTSPINEKLTQGPAVADMWGSSCPESLPNCRQAACLLGRPDLVPYQVRHSGASTDRADGSRTQEEIRARRGWTTASSAARYRKVARMAQTIARHPEPMRNYFAKCSEELP